MLGSSVASTGDLNGNVQRLRRELGQVKFVAEVDDVGVRLGDPVALLPLLNHSLLKFSRHVAKHITQCGFELSGKTDQRFVEAAFKLFRDHLNVKTALTPAHFLNQGYAERKVLLLCDVVGVCKKLHNEGVRKERLAALKATRTDASVSRLSVPSSRKSPDVKVVRGGSDLRQVLVPRHSPTASDGAQQSQHPVTRNGPSPNRRSASPPTSAGPDRGHGMSSTTDTSPAPADPSHPWLAWPSTPSPATQAQPPLQQQQEQVHQVQAHQQHQQVQEQQQQQQRHRTQQQQQRPQTPPARLPHHSPSSNPSSLGSHQRLQPHHQPQQRSPAELCDGDSGTPGLELTFNPLASPEGGSVQAWFMNPAYSTAAGTGTDASAWGQGQQQSWDDAGVEGYRQPAAWLNEQLPSSSRLQFGQQQRPWSAAGATTSAAAAAAAPLWEPTASDWAQHGGLGSVEDYQPTIDWNKRPSPPAHTRPRDGGSLAGSAEEGLDSGSGSDDGRLTTGIPSHAHKGLASDGGISESLAHDQTSRQHDSSSAVHGSAQPQHLQQQQQQQQPNKLVPPHILVHRYDQHASNVQDPASPQPAEATESTPLQQGGQRSSNRSRQHQPHQTQFATTAQQQQQQQQQPDPPQADMCEDSSSCDVQDSRLGKLQQQQQQADTHAAGRTTAAQPPRAGDGAHAHAHVASLEGGIPPLPSWPSVQGPAEAHPHSATQPAPLHPMPPPQRGGPLHSNRPTLHFAPTALQQQQRERHHSLSDNSPPQLPTHPSSRARVVAHSDGQPSLTYPNTRSSNNNTAAATMPVTAASLHAGAAGQPLQQRHGMAAATHEGGSVQQQPRQPRQLLMVAELRASQDAGVCEVQRALRAAEEALGGQIRRLQDRLSSAEEMLEQSRAEAQSTRTTMTATVAILEGRIRFLECEPRPHAAQQGRGSVRGGPSPERAHETPAHESPAGSGQQQYQHPGMGSGQAGQQHTAHAVSAARQAHAQQHAAPAGKSASDGVQAQAGQAHAGQPGEGAFTAYSNALYQQHPQPGMPHASLQQQMQPQQQLQHWPSAVHRTSSTTPSQSFRDARLLHMRSSLADQPPPTTADSQAAPLSNPAADPYLEHHSARLPHSASESNGQSRSRPSSGSQGSTGRLFVAHPTPMPTPSFKFRPSELMQQAADAAADMGQGNPEAMQPSQADSSSASQSQQQIQGGSVTVTRHAPDTHATARPDPARHQEQHHHQQGPSMYNGQVPRYSAGERFDPAFALPQSVAAPPSSVSTAASLRAARHSATPLPMQQLHAAPTAGSNSRDSHASHPSPALLQQQQQQQHRPPPLQPAQTPAHHQGLSPAGAAAAAAKGRPVSILQQHAAAAPARAWSSSTGRLEVPVQHATPLSTPQQPAARVGARVAGSQSADAALHGDGVRSVPPVSSGSTDELISSLYSRYTDAQAFLSSLRRT
ncbi:MAG: hypothetical protein WDW36_005212 [Sanguina aurantia]